MKAVSFFVLAILLLGSNVAFAKEITTEHFNIRYKNISEEQAKDFSQKAEKALVDVTNYLGRTSDEKIMIDISDKHRVPFTEGTKIKMPANRIRGDAGGPKRIRGRGPAIAHEITHVVAVSKRKDRFLDEGLGVYIQEKFGGDRSYPNMGKDVHEETARLIRYYKKRIPLKKCEKVRKDRKAGVGQSVAYLQEGSFVRFLIENHGLDDFMRVFDGESYENVYGKSFDDLENEWAGFIETNFNEASQ